MRVVPLTPQPGSEQVIAVLEETLAKAREGRINAVVVCTRDPDDLTTDIAHVGANTPEVLGMLVIATQVVLRMGTAGGSA